jgi:hypothetical protein
MKLCHTLLAVLFLASCAARAQEVPATAGNQATTGNQAATSPPATGRAGLPVNGMLHYDLHYSQSTQFGGVQGDQQWSSTSGDASYTNTNARLPFSMQYGGGYGWAWNGAPSAGNVFQHLSLSQGVAWRRWNLSASGNASYTFETPTTGFTGVPGTGEPIGGPGSNPLSGLTILTQNTRSVSDTMTVSIGHSLGYATSLSFGGSSGQSHFIDNNGGNSDTLMVNAGITRRLNARSSASASYSFSRFNYGANYAYQVNGAQISFSQANSVQFGISRQWNWKIGTSVSIGPQWVSSSNSAISPSSTMLSMSASVNDTFKFGTGSLSYSRGSTGGSGYMLGAESDVASANFSHQFGKKTSFGLTGSYMRTAGLNGNGLTNGKFAGVQASRQVGRYLSVFGNYTAVSQSSNLVSTANVLNNVFQSVSFGIGYSPREIRLKK